MVFQLRLVNAVRDFSLCSEKMSRRWLLPLASHHTLAPPDTEHIAAQPQRSKITNTICQ